MCSLKEEDDKAPCHLCQYLGPARLSSFSRYTHTDQDRLVFEIVFWGVAECRPCIQTLF